MSAQGTSHPGAGLTVESGLAGPTEPRAQGPVSSPARPARAHLHRGGKSLARAGDELKDRSPHLPGVSPVERRESLKVLILRELLK